MSKANDERRPVRGSDDERADLDRTPDDSGAYLGNRPELGADSIVSGSQRDDERIAGEATQSTGPAGHGANPDEGQTRRRWAGT